MTLTTFKTAIRQDGNLKSLPGHAKLNYVTRQIDGEARLSAGQRDKLHNWAADRYGD